MAKATVGAMVWAGPWAAAFYAAVEAEWAAPEPRSHRALEARLEAFEDAWGWGAGAALAEIGRAADEAEIAAKVARRRAAGGAR